MNKIGRTSGVGVGQDTVVPLNSPRELEDEAMTIENPTTDHPQIKIIVDVVVCVGVGVGVGVVAAAVRKTDTGDPLPPPPTRHSLYPTLHVTYHAARDKFGNVAATKHNVTQR